MAAEALHSPQPRVKIVVGSTLLSVGAHPLNGKPKRGPPSNQDAPGGVRPLNFSGEECARGGCVAEATKRKACFAGLVSPRTRRGKSSLLPLRQAAGTGCTLRVCVFCTRSAAPAPFVSVSSQAEASSSMVETSATSLLKVRCVTRTRGPKFDYVTPLVHKLHQCPTLGPRPWTGSESVSLTVRRA